jgi:anhydro-N-acetylmuramic acid kinase
MRVLGLMSGTSLDGVDCALVEFASGTTRTLTTCFAPFDAALRAELLALQAATPDELHRSASAANGVAHAYAACVASALEEAGLAASEVTAIGAHGQTVRHRPELGYTLQLLNPALLAELTGITVVSDFRSRDVAAGGQGAPLAPGFHLAAFADAQAPRAVVNIGGIANVSWLVPGAPPLGFDTGPGNVLIDAWCAEHLGKPYDAGGAWAAQGQVNENLLARMLAEPYLALPPPKSTGRDLFDSAWLKPLIINGLQAIDVTADAAADVAATVSELTARTIVDGIVRHCAHSTDTPLHAYVCGGGAHNQTLMRRLQALSPRWVWATTEALGVPPDWVEAVAFAWLAHQTLKNLPGNLASVTGAHGPRVLGSITPGKLGYTPAA